MTLRFQSGCIHLLCCVFASRGSSVQITEHPDEQQRVCGMQDGATISCVNKFDGTAKKYADERRVSPDGCVWRKLGLEHRCLYSIVHVRLNRW